MKILFCMAVKKKLFNTINESLQKIVFKRVKSVKNKTWTIFTNKKSYTYIQYQLVYLRKIIICINNRLKILNKKQESIVRMQLMFLTRSLKIQKKHKYSMQLK